MNLDDAIANRPDGGYRVILADPPWNMRTWSKKGLDGRPQHYKRMSMGEIKAMPVDALAADDCNLFLWTSAPFLEHAMAVIRAWNFKYSSVGFTWVKMWPSQADQMFMDSASFCIGQGYTTRKNTEICLLAKRGKPKRESKAVRELMFAARREHSRKPDETFTRIEQYSSGPYCELFARSQRPGWTCLGDQSGMFK